jgi:23S rRNA (cytidine1920-2'-O)/16S rRNA (cytidine1409-2'-O)-methyltransferase
LSGTAVINASRGTARSSRLDALLVERGLVESRTRAQALVLAGQVRVGGEVAGKAGQKVSSDAELSVEGGSRFVSRAGGKLDHALDAFGIPVEGRDCLDAGASTGGFTDVLLGRGAGRVLSVDVGYGQFAWRLRNDSRVSLMERTNVRYLSGENLPFEPDLLVADLSFISLFVALEKICRTTPGLREAVLLVKPQFEAGPEHVSRGGIVREPAARAAAIRSVAEAFAPLGFGAVGITRSPIVGRKSGNREYPIHLSRGSAVTLAEEEMLAVVEED